MGVVADRSWRRQRKQMWRHPTLVAVALALSAWALGPVLYVLARAIAEHRTFTGAVGLFPGDQLQYLSWIRSSGGHWLAADDFDIARGAHVFLHPMFFLSGLLWRAGTGIALSFLIWLPVAAAVLYFGFAAYIRSFGGSRPAQAATLTLAVFFAAPAAAIANWGGHSPGLASVGGEMTSATLLWGYLPNAVTLGLMALCVRQLSRLAEPVPSCPGSLLRASGLGALVAWLHPWQGETLLLVIAGLVIINRRPIRWTLVFPAAATALPLGYYLVLSKVDQGWEIAQSQTPMTRPGVLTLAVALAPLLPFVVVGAATLGRSARDQTVILWPVAALLIYFLLATSDPPHALEGISLPLAILAVRGWRRMNLPSWLAVLAVALMTVPGLVYYANLLRRSIRSDTPGMLLNHDESRALAFLDQAQAPGGVLPSVNISTTVPAFTGRRSWLGHPIWTPAFYVRVREATELFEGDLTVQAERTLIAQAHAHYLLDDCGKGFRPGALGPLVSSVRRYGCVVIYTVALHSPPAAA